MGCLPRSKGKLVLGGALALATVAATGSADAGGFKVLHDFQGSDGYAPYAALILDKQGNLYGTTTLGGASDGGVVFKLAPDGTETVLHSFASAGGSDGTNPYAGLIADKKGSLYGTTELGGAGCNGRFGCGTVFKIAPDGNESVLHPFTDGSDGGNPVDSLFADKAGNLYGTAYNGGEGFGTIFKLAPDGTETTLHAFKNTFSDGGNPSANLVADKAGNLYGTTYSGGEGHAGTVFKLTPDGIEAVLFSFDSVNSFGTNPAGGLTMDGRGNLYGTASQGGPGCVVGCGTVFKVTKTGAFTLLYNFKGGSDGSFPGPGLVLDAKGNLYGTTFIGGEHDKGTVFKLTPAGREVIVYSFTGGSDGANPDSALIADGNGNLYGTTVNGAQSQCGSSGCGTVFLVKE